MNILRCLFQQKSYFEKYNAHNIIISAESITGAMRKNLAADRGPCAMHRAAVCSLSGKLPSTANNVFITARAPVIAPRKLSAHADNAILNRRSVALHSVSAGTIELPLQTSSVTGCEI